MDTNNETSLEFDVTLRIDTTRENFEKIWQNKDYVSNIVKVNWDDDDACASFDCLCQEKLYLTTEHAADTCFIEKSLEDNIREWLYKFDDDVLEWKITDINKS